MRSREWVKVRKPWARRLVFSLIRLIASARIRRVGPPEPLTCGDALDPVAANARTVNRAGTYCVRTLASRPAVAARIASASRRVHSKVTVSSSSWLAPMSRASMYCRSELPPAPPKVFVECASTLRGLRRCPTPCGSDLKRPLARAAALSGGPHARVRHERFGATHGPCAVPGGEDLGAIVGRWFEFDEVTQVVAQRGVDLGEQVCSC